MLETGRSETVVNVLVPFVPKSTRQKNCLISAAKLLNLRVPPKSMTREFRRHFYSIMSPSIYSKDGAS